MVEVLVTLLCISVADVLFMLVIRKTALRFLTTDAEHRHVQEELLVNYLIED